MLHFIITFYFLQTNVKLYLYNIIWRKMTLYKLKCNSHDVKYASHLYFYCENCVEDIAFPMTLHSCCHKNSAQLVYADCGEQNIPAMKILIENIIDKPSDMCWKGVSLNAAHLFPRTFNLPSLKWHLYVQFFLPPPSHVPFIPTAATFIFNVSLSYIFLVFISLSHALTLSSLVTHIRTSFISLFTRFSGMEVQKIGRFIFIFLFPLSFLFWKEGFSQRLLFYSHSGLNTPHVYFHSVSLCVSTDICLYKI